MIYFLAVSIEKSEMLEPKIERTASLDIRSSQNMEGIEAGSTPSLMCKLNVPGQVWWSTGDRNLTTVKVDFELTTGRLDIKKASRNDTGEYKCSALTADGESLEKTIHIRVIGMIDLSISYLNVYLSLAFKIHHAIMILMR